MQRHRPWDVVWFSNGCTLEESYVDDVCMESMARPQPIAFIYFRGILTAEYLLGLDACKIFRTRYVRIRFDIVASCSSPTTSWRPSCKPKTGMEWHQMVLQWAQGAISVQIFESAEHVRKTEWAMAQTTRQGCWSQILGKSTTLRMEQICQRKLAGPPPDIFVPQVELWAGRVTYHPQTWNGATSSRCRHVRVQMHSYDAFTVKHCRTFLNSTLIQHDPKSAFHPTHQYAGKAFEPTSNLVLYGRRYAKKNEWPCKDMRERTTPWTNHRQNDAEVSRWAPLAVFATQLKKGKGAKKRLAFLLTTTSHMKPVVHILLKFDFFLFRVWYYIHTKHMISLRLLIQTVLSIPNRFNSKQHFVTVGEALNRIGSKAARRKQTRNFTFTEREARKDNKYERSYSHTFTIPLLFGKMMKMMIWWWTVSGGCVTLFCFWVVLSVCVWCVVCGVWCVVCGVCCVVCGVCCVVVLLCCCVGVWCVVCVVLCCIVVLCVVVLCVVVLLCCCVVVLLCCCVVVLLLCCCCCCVFVWRVWRSMNHHTTLPCSFEKNNNQLYKKRFCWLCST